MTTRIAASRIGSDDPPTTRQVERIVSPTADYLYRNHIKTSRPVVIAGGINQWKAYSLWTFDYLKSKIGASTVPIEVSLDGSNVFPSIHNTENFETRGMTVNDYIDKTIFGKTTGEKYYLAHLSIPETFPELVNDIEYPPCFDMNSCLETNLWFGSSGTQSPLHHDHADNWFTQVAGRKRFLLFSPAETKWLYPYGCKSGVPHFSQVEMEKLDVERFPDFSNATPLECMLEPGDVLFLPVFWWHQVYSVETSISVSMWWRPKWRKHLHRRQFYRMILWQLYNRRLDPLF